MEKLYICDHAGECRLSKCGGHAPRTMEVLIANASILRLTKGSVCSGVNSIVKGIPYKPREASAEPLFLGFDYGTCNSRAAFKEDIVEKQFEIAKEFTAFDWMTSAHERGYANCDNFKQDVKWLFEHLGRDPLRTFVELDSRLQTYLNSHPDMREHWLDEGFIQEKAEENPFNYAELSGASILLDEQFIASFSSKGLTLHTVCKNLGFPTDGQGRIKIIN